jgi:hypothetical protein
VCACGFRVCVCVCVCVFGISECINQVVGTELCISVQLMQFC